MIPSIVLTSDEQKILTGIQKEYPEIANITKVHELNEDELKKNITKE